MRLQMRLLTTAVFALGLSLNGFAQESTYKARVLNEGPPKGLAPAIVKVLHKSGTSVNDPSGKVICNVWLRTRLPAMPDFQEQLDLKYPIKPGALVGAIQFPAGGRDFRQQKIKPGVYTLRYSHQPQDGNHLGTAEIRDFLAVCHPDNDKSPEEVAEDPLLDLSTKVSGSAHPAILSLMPPQGAPAKVPMMVRDEMLGLEILIAKTSDTDGKDVVIEPVTVGHAEE